MFARTQLLVVLLSLVHVCTGMQCTLCAPGKFKSPDMLFTLCTLCPENTFSAVPGAAQCARCPPFSSSVNGSSRCTFEPCRAENYTTGCVCPVGTTGADGGVCDACVVGTYKNGTGDASCDNCSSTKTSVAGSASCFCKADYITTDTGDCLPCKNGMISRENSATCFCPNGTALVDRQCAQIYNKGLRLSGVIDLEAFNASNTSSSNVDALIAQITRSIALQYNISEDLVQVIFTSGSRKLLQESGSVEVVIMAQSKEELARVVNQTTTEPPRMIQNVQSEITAIKLSGGIVEECPANEDSSMSTACVCKPGYTRELGKCVGCAPGQDKPLSGDAGCATCSGNTFSRTAAARCSACPLSAVMTDNHRSCSCNTAFVFFKDTCTATEAVYLNVSGVLQLPQGEFRDPELKQILLDGFSAHLNFSKQFITILISRNNTVDNDTNANVTSVTSNSTAGRRRLLYDLPLELYFNVLMQIEKDDTTTYAKIKNFTTSGKNRIITDANAYRIVLGKLDLTRGYFSADGKPVSKCADGQNRVQDFFTKLLFCDNTSSCDTI